MPLVLNIIQCAQRWEELRTSSLAVAGDFSGLTATGRPISGQGKRQMTRYVRSMFSQQMSTGSSPSRGSYSHGNVTKSQSGHHYTRHSSGHSNGTLIERPRSSMAQTADSASSHHTSEQSGKFVANFCQTVLNGGGGVGGRGQQGRDENRDGVHKSTTAEVTR